MSDLDDMRARAERAERIADAYKRRLILMHGHEDRACPMDTITAIIDHTPGASAVEKLAAISYTLRTWKGTFEYKGVVGTFFHGCGNAHLPGDPCPTEET